MNRGLTSRRFPSLAPRIVGAFIIASLAMAGNSCRKKNGTPAWSAPPNEATATTGNSKRQPATQPSSRSATRTPAAAPSTAESTATSGLRFIAYNVENWLTMDRFVDQKPLKNSPKPAAEKQTAIRILTNHAPDVVGLCEIGESSDLEEIRQALKAAGLDLPHSQYTGGSDPVRHLGLLSRFPITSQAKPAETEFRMKGQTFAINRGILDASVQARGKSYRFLGVHLKSKREIEHADQDEMRIHEARLLRRHVDAILTSEAKARLVVYGDFNDSRQSTAFKTITGGTNDPGYLTAIALRDSRGESWTHYWALHDIYSRFDYVAVTRAIKPEVDFRASCILDDPAWNDASDHRPVLAIFK